MSLLNLEKSSSKEDLNRFKQWQKEKRLILIRFHATWCGHCDAMTNEWETFLKNTSFSRLSELRVASVESELLAELELENEVPFGYPTIKMYQGTQSVAEFSGKRDAPTFHKFTSTTYDDVLGVKAHAKEAQTPTTKKKQGGHRPQKGRRRSVRGGNRVRRRHSLRRGCRLRQSRRRA